MEIRFCCPNKYSAGQCNVDGYTWSGWHNSDGPGDDGDWEGENPKKIFLTLNILMRNSCLNLGYKRQVTWSSSEKIFRV